MERPRSACPAAVMGDVAARARRFEERRRSHLQRLWQSTKDTLALLRSPETAKKVVRTPRPSFVWERWLHGQGSMQGGLYRYQPGCPCLWEPRATRKEKPPNSNAPTLSRYPQPPGALDVGREPILMEFVQDADQLDAAAS